MPRELTDGVHTIRIEERDGRATYVYVCCGASGNDWQSFYPEEFQRWRPVGSQPLPDKSDMED